MNLLIAAVLTMATPAFALTAPNCQLAYKASIAAAGDAATLSLVRRAVAIPGVAGKASTVFVNDGVVNSVTAAAEDDRLGVTKLTISVDLANGSDNEENTFFINAFGDYRGQRITSLILRPEGQVRFSFPFQPGSNQQPQPLTFRGSVDWSASAIQALSGKTINQIEVVCSSDLR